MMKQYDVTKCNCQTLMQMYLLKEMPVKEIAKRIGIPESKVRDRIKICKNLLQQILKEKGYL